MFNCVDKFAHLVAVHGVDYEFGKGDQFRSKQHIEKLNKVHTMFYGETPLHKTAYTRQSRPWGHLILPFSSWGTHMAGLYSIYGHERAMSVVFIPALVDISIKSWLGQLWGSKREPGEILTSYLLSMSGTGYLEEAYEFFLGERRFSKWDISSPSKTLKRIPITRDLRRLYENVAKTKKRDDMFLNYMKYKN